MAEYSSKAKKVAKILRDILNERILTCPSIYSTTKPTSNSDLNVDFFSFYFEIGQEEEADLYIQILLPKYSLKTYEAYCSNRDWPLRSSPHEQTRQPVRSILQLNHIQHGCKLRFPFYGIFSCMRPDMIQLAFLVVPMQIYTLIGQQPHPTPALAVLFQLLEK